jgi:hypothetical protein
MDWDPWGLTWMRWFTHFAAPSGSRSAEIIHSISDSRCLPLEVILQDIIFPVSESLILGGGVFVALAGAGERLYTVRGDFLTVDDFLPPLSVQNFAGSFRGWR